ncbi:hypothetical protein B0J18DRAFT_423649 [Chaetomium sp. MPI-SDFR-AT-0129]|nr:hypothetical protein B0J18DRAFT_423649 [Chaetomium sp. MPI-SDFR-AT-0129]
MFLVLDLAILTIYSPLFPFLFFFKQLWHLLLSPSSGSYLLANAKMETRKARAVWGWMTTGVALGPDHKPKG